MLNKIGQCCLLFLALLYGGGGVLALHRFVEHGHHDGVVAGGCQDSQHTSEHDSSSDESEHEDSGCLVCIHMVHQNLQIAQPTGIGFALLENVGTHVAFQHALLSGYLSDHGARGPPMA